MRVTMMRRRLFNRFPLLSLTAREIMFRVYCRHEQGPRPNVLLYCSRRGGSTWLLNTLAAHPGVRYVGRTFDALLSSRWAKLVPPLNPSPSASAGLQKRRIYAGFRDDDLARFRPVAESVIGGRRHIHPSLNFRADYFEQRTERIVFQMTNATALIEWFDQEFDVETVLLLRHPIPTALSILKQGWQPEDWEFVTHEGYVTRYLTDAQLQLAKDIVAEGSVLERHVLDWTLKMLVPVRAFESGRHRDWILVTYEQMVLEPERVLRHLAERLDFPHLAPMLEQVGRPSRSVTPETAGRVDDPSYLLDRWRDRVSTTQERELLRIPEAFDLCMYRVESRTASGRYLLE